MKSKKTIVMLSALAALCLLSCNNDEEVNVYDGAVRFTAGIGKEAVATPQSRAAGTQWSIGDGIGIFMVGNSTTTIAGDAENKEYTTGNGDGNFTPIMGSEIYYPMDNSAVDFIAYYPYQDNAALSTALPVEIAAAQTDASQPTFDLMWAKANNTGAGYTKDGDATVAFTFGHCLSKLTMNCKVDASVGDAKLLADAKVIIKGMNTRNSFDIATGTLGSTPDTPAAITARKLSAAPNNNYDGTYDAIILPGSYEAGKLSVEFVINNETFVWDVDKIEFKGGSEYIYDVNITRTGVKVKGTITDWSPVDKGPVTAE